MIKISNLGEDPAVLDLETEAILHIAAADPDLPVARPRAVSDAADPASYRPTTEGPEGRTSCACSSGCPAGRRRPEATSSGRARLRRDTRPAGLALRGFFHPAAGRSFLWDTKNALGLRPLVPRSPIRGSALVEGCSTATRGGSRRLAAAAQPGHPRRPGPRQRAAGRPRPGGRDHRLRRHRPQRAGRRPRSPRSLCAVAGQTTSFAARLLIDGFQSRVPLEPQELELLADLVAARLRDRAISAWRVISYPENAEYIQAWDPGSWMLLNLFDRVGMDTVAQELGAARAARADGELRAAARGPGLGDHGADLFRAGPRPARRRAVAVRADGRRLLDVYNNVPVVGHCHPRVTEAVVRQTRTLNTHSRYLYEPLMDLAERLIAPCRAAGAWTRRPRQLRQRGERPRVADRHGVHRGAGALVTEFAYHGVTTVIAEISPEEWPAGYRPHVERSRLPRRLGAESRRGRAGSRRAGIAPAAAYLDGGFTSDGVRTPAPADVAAMVDGWRDAGGLFVADEVQAGHGRTGDHLWSFQGFGIEPDFVTLGKPMGNGYPVAALITRRRSEDRFAGRASSAPSAATPSPPRRRSPCSM